MLKYVECARMKSSRHLDQASDRSWRKETINDTIILVTHLICCLWTRHQLYLSKAILHLSYNVIPCQEYENRKELIIFCEQLGHCNYKQYWKIAIWACADNYFYIAVTNVSTKNFQYSILSQENFPPFCDIKNIYPWGNGCIHCIHWMPRFMDEWNG